MTGENRLDATMEVVLPGVGPGEVVPYRIVNTGTVDLICGLPYRLERQADDGWVLMNPGMHFRLRGISI